MHQVFVRYTKFVELDEQGRESSVYYGYHIFDDYEEDYNNSFDSFEELKKELNEVSVREYVKLRHLDFFDGLGATEIVFN